ncbi:hypothetical protein [Sphingobium sp. WCS2017Hpa-17]|uniref:hypothetical protein n=1 Tax=Sphingobium sp. WCS2017Hpa-17 TaxID=3073638 RepID=UPI002889F58D|nr:hypothetical protein [Sphingobium sp. WCS2017Hpa-17]
MKTNIAPFLPLDLPMFEPDTPPNNEEGAEPPPVMDPQQPGIAISVDATVLTIDERFSMSFDELSTCHAEAAAAARSDLYLGRPQSAFPIVTASADGRYSVLTELPLILAALALARDEAEPVTLMVIVVAEPPGPALLNAMLNGPCTPSLYEQSCYIRGCTAKYGGRRAWMCAEQIDLKRWEGRFSKIAKIGELDPGLLERIDPFSISNAEIAGRIVDIWSDPQQRAVAQEVVAQEARATNARLKAPALFKKIVRAVDGVGTSFAISPWRNGACEMRSLDGSLIATARADHSGWTITGGDASTLSRAAIGALCQILQTYETAKGGVEP